MIDRVRQAFERARSNGRIALVPFITVGHPTVDASIAAASAVVSGGADIVELGVPFSDPLAEGPTIQKSSFHALKQGVTLETCIGAARRLRKDGLDAPLILMGYYNPIISFGAREFCREAAGAGVDGLIVVDLPVEEAEPLRREANEAGMSLIPLLALTSSTGRIAAACGQASGFVYCVSVLGTTGARAAVSLRVRGLVENVRRHTSLPTAVGFGISHVAHVEQVAEFADGAAVGSALVECLDAGPVKSAPERAYEFVKGLAAGTLLPGSRKNLPNAH